MMTYELCTNSTTNYILTPLKYIRTRHFLGDCKWLLSVFFKKDPMRPFLYPKRWRALWDFKTEIFKSKGDIFDIRDLKPSFMEYIDILTK